MFVTDVTERRALEQRLAEEARRDPLTGVANRKAFDLIRIHEGKSFDLANVQREDPAVYEMLQKADAIGATIKPAAGVTGGIIGDVGIGRRR